MSWRAPALMVRQLASWPAGIRVRAFSLLAMICLFANGPWAPAAEQAGQDSESKKAAEQRQARVRNWLQILERSAIELSQCGQVAGTLQVLELWSSGKARPELTWPLQAFLKAPLELQPGETVQDALRRQAAPRKLKPGELTDCNYGSIEQLEQKYQDLTGEPAPTDWRRREQFWLDFAAETLESRTALDPAAVWRKRIAAHPEQAELCRLVYLEVLRVRTAKQFDQTLLAPLLDKLNPEEEANRLGLLINALRLPNGALPAWGAELHERLLHILQTTPIQPTKGRITGWQLLSKNSPAPERLRRVETVLQHQDPRRAAWLIGWVGESGENRQHWFLAKKTTVNVREVKLAELLRSLTEAVRLPLWIEEDVESDDMRITLQTEGTWLQVVEQVLAESEYRIAFLPDDVVWIGRPESRLAVERRLREAKARIPAGSPAAYWMESPVEVFWHGLNWRECVAYLNDFAGSNIVPLQQDWHESVDLAMVDVPGYLILDRVADQAGLSWETDGAATVMADKQGAARFRERVARRIERSRGLTAAQAAQLKAPVDVDLRKASAAEVMTWLKETAGATVDLTAAELTEKPVTLALKQVPLETALDVLTLQLGLDWSPGKITVRKPARQ